MSVDNNDKQEKDIKNIIAFALIVIIAIIIAFFNWSKGFRTSNKTKEENKSEQEIRSNIQEIKNILNDGIKNLKNISDSSQKQENTNSYGYGYGYGYSDIDYNSLLKNIKPEDIEEYIRDSNEIDNTLKNEGQNKTE